MIISTLGAERLATAGHCVRVFPQGAVYSLHSIDGSDTTNTNPGWRSEGYYGDSGYMSHGTMDPYPTFYYDWSLKRYVYNERTSGEMFVGDRVCHFGRTTGASCAYIRHTTGVVLTFDQIDHKNVISMDRLVDDLGDSGGPWYYGNDAFGVQSGHLGSGCGSLDMASCSVFSPMYLFDLQGLTVETQ